LRDPNSSNFELSSGEFLFRMRNVEFWKEDQTKLKIKVEMKNFPEDRNFELRFLKLQYSINIWHWVEEYWFDSLFVIRIQYFFLLWFYPHIVSFQRNIWKS
jgi:hypothetical protein